MTDDDFEALLRGQPTSTVEEKPSRGRRRSQAPRSSRGAGALILTTVLLIVAGLGGAGWWAWDRYGERVLNFLGEEEVADFPGPGSPPEILVVIENGEFGDAVAQRLFDQGVTASYEAVYELLLQDPSITFQPGTYRLLTGMSGAGALEALADPQNRLLYRVTIPEGRTLNQTLEIIADETDIELADLTRAVEDPSVYGINPPESDSYLQPLEGYLFPATYEIEPGESASTVIQRMVQEMVNRLEARQVPADQWHELLTKASMVQREVLEEDFGKAARVIENRLDDEMILQFDSTVTYWENSFGTVWTSDAARANPDNPYNTYYYTGLPLGPIGLPGEAAIDAVLEPDEGDWKYFVTVNLESGATSFSVTLQEHNGAVALLNEWCAQPENDAFCD